MTTLPILITDQHDLIAPAVQYVIAQDDVMPDASFEALPGVLRKWETALRAVLALHANIGGTCEVCAGPEDYDENSEGERSWYSSSASYPCPTVTAITAALGCEAGK